MFDKSNNEERENVQFLTDNSLQFKVWSMDYDCDWKMERVSSEN